MRRRYYLIGLVLLLAAVGGPLTAAQVAPGEHVACVTVSATAQSAAHEVGVDGAPVHTIPGETVVASDSACVTATDQTVTVTETVTTAPPTTTEPPPTTTTEPDPPGGEVIDVTVSNQLGWYCNNRELDIALLRVTAVGSADNAVTLDNCSGRIDRIEITTHVVDGIKIRNNANGVAHDLVIGGGFIRSANCVPGGHCDGVQAMGGDRITFENVLIDFRNATGGGGFYPSMRAGGGPFGEPTHIVCDGCHLIHGATSVRVDASDFSGVRNSVICAPSGNPNLPDGNAHAVYAHGETRLVSPIGVSRFPVTIRFGQNEDALSAGNVLAAASDPRCVTEPG